MIEIKNSAQKTVPSSVIIRVDRRVIPKVPVIAPNFPVSFARPDLMTFGPNQYPLSQVKLWSHPRQEFNGGMPGDQICKYLDDMDHFKLSLGLHDADEIKKLNIKTYRQYFGGEMIIFWKSILMVHAGGFLVLCLFEIQGGIGSVWVDVKKLVGCNRPGVFFKKVGRSQFFLQ